MNLEILYLFLVPVLTGILIFLFGKKSRFFSEGIAILGSAITFVISSHIFLLTTKGEVLSIFQEELRMDALGGLVAWLVTFIGLIAVIYSIPYMRKEMEKGIIRAERLRSYYGWLMIFLASMLWATTTNNIILLWVIIEATTLASIILVAFYWNRDALEAGYKYAMLLTVGITFALFGCVFLYVGSSPHIPSGLDPLKITEIAKVAGKIPKSIALLSVILLLVGFGTKAGIVPFHTWLPDAHAEAPTPISALLSGVMIKVGAYALARTVTAFFPVYHDINLFIVILGVVTMLVGIFMALMQDDLKRLLAYHSVSQMGYIIVGLGVGTYLGVYGGLFHLLNHTIFKALLFLCVGAVASVTGTRLIHNLGGIGRKMPITALCFFVGAFAIGGLPLFNGFMSKFTIFLACAKAGMLWATLLAILTSILTLFCLLHAAYCVFMGKAIEATNPINKEIKEVSALMWGGMLLLAFLCLLIGVYPQIVYPILNEATKAVFSMMPMP
ncbi:MAG: proton-conducting transporter membrane subunit [Syntrophales bacterium]|nr:proton-conducting transporter membrane subunit [Syntrophales bacterium]